MTVESRVGPHRHVASPRARRLLREHGLDPASVRGSGSDGRVRAADVTAAMRDRESVRQLGFVAMNVDFHAIDRAGLGRGYVPFVAYAVLDAIRIFPELRARAGSGPGVHLHVDDAVIAHADELRFEALARLIDDPPGTGAAATFWLRHPGKYGTTFSGAALPASAVASLALEAVRPTPVAVPTPDGYALAVHPVGAVSLTFDAAAVDEATAAQFLARVRETLEGADWLKEIG